jgi:hypothetical protein
MTAGSTQADDNRIAVEKNYRSATLADPERSRKTDDRKMPMPATDIMAPTRPVEVQP